MTDLTVTAADVLRISGTTQQVTAGATVTRGQVVVKRADGKWDPGSADGTSATAELAGSSGLGIALNDAGDGQPLTIQTDGEIDPGATPTAGVIYVLSPANAGGIAPSDDLVALDDDFVTIVGVGDGTNIDLCLFASGSIV